MPVLTNPKWEIFAQELAKGATQSEAYGAAGYSPQRSNAARLITNDSIVSRVAELQAIAGANAEVTIESLIREADELQRLARTSGQYSASITALTAKAKLAGLWVEKSESTRIQRQPTDLTDEEIVDRIAKLRGAFAPAGDKQAPVDPSQLN